MSDSNPKISYIMEEAWAFCVAFFKLTAFWIDVIHLSLNWKNVGNNSKHWF